MGYFYDDKEGGGPEFLENFTVPRSAVLEEQYVRAIEENPVWASYRMLELNAAHRTGPKLLPAEAEQRLKSAGLTGHIPVPQAGITNAALETLMFRKNVELRRQDVESRAAGGFLELAGRLGVSLAAGFADPVNVGFGFLPVVGQARYLKWLEQAKGAAGRLGVRAGVGAIEGTVGATAIEPLISASRAYEHYDYDAVDSLMNISFGAVFGATLHTAVGGGIELANLGRSLGLLPSRVAEVDIPRGPPPEFEIGPRPGDGGPPSGPRTPAQHAAAAMETHLNEVAARTAAQDADRVHADLAGARERPYVRPGIREEEASLTVRFEAPPEELRVVELGPEQQELVAAESARLQALMESDSRFATGDEAVAIDYLTRSLSDEGFRRFAVVDGEGHIVAGISVAVNPDGTATALHLGSIRKGAGKLLVENLKKKGKEQGIKFADFHPRPGSESFHAKRGATQSDEVSDTMRLTLAEPRVNPELVIGPKLDELFDRVDGMGAVPNNQEVGSRGFTRDMRVAEFQSLHAELETPNVESLTAIEDQITSGGKLGPVFLTVEWDPGSIVWRVVGHEGRHRALAISEMFGPDSQIPVDIFPRGLRAQDLSPEMRTAPIITERAISAVPPDQVRSAGMTRRDFLRGAAAVAASVVLPTPRLPAIAAAAAPTVAAATAAAPTLGPIAAGYARSILHRYALLHQVLDGTLTMKRARDQLGILPGDETPSVPIPETPLKKGLDSLSDQEVNELLQRRGLYQPLEESVPQSDFEERLSSDLQDLDRGFGYGDENHLLEGFDDSATMDVLEDLRLPGVEPFKVVESDFKGAQRQLSKVPKSAVRESVEFRFRVAAHDGENWELPNTAPEGITPNQILSLIQKNKTTKDVLVRLGSLLEVNGRKSIYLTPSLWDPIMEAILKLKPEDMKQFDPNVRMESIARGPELERAPEVPRLTQESGQDRTLHIERTREAVGQGVIGEPVDVGPDVPRLTQQPRDVVSLDEFRAIRESNKRAVKTLEKSIREELNRSLKEIDGRLKKGWEVPTEVAERIRGLKDFKDIEELDVELMNILDRWDDLDWHNNRTLYQLRESDDVSPEPPRLTDERGTFTPETGEVPGQVTTLPGTQRYEMTLELQDKLPTESWRDWAGRVAEKHDYAAANVHALMDVAEAGTDERINALQSLMELDVIPTARDVEVFGSKAYEFTPEEMAVLYDEWSQAVPEPVREADILQFPKRDWIEGKAGPDPEVRNAVEQAEVTLKEVPDEPRDALDEDLSMAEAELAATEKRLGLEKTEPTVEELELEEAAKRADRWAKASEIATTCIIRDT